MFKLRPCVLLCLFFLTLGGCSKDVGINNASANDDNANSSNASDHNISDVSVETDNQKQEFSVEAYLGPDAELLSREENAELYDTISVMMKKQYELQIVILNGWGSSDTLTEINGKKEYILVEYSNVRSWADFEACLTEVYDEEYIKAIRSWFSEGEDPLFLDYEGGLYRRMADAGTKAVNSDKMQLYRIKTGEVALVCEEYASVFDIYVSEFDIYVLYLKQNSDKPYGYEIKWKR